MGGPLWGVKENTCKSSLLLFRFFSVSFSPICFARQLSDRDPNVATATSPLELPTPHTPSAHSFYMNLNEVIIGFTSPVDIVVVDGCQYYCPRYFNRICMLLFMGMYLFISEFSHPFLCRRLLLWLICFYYSH